MKLENFIGGAFVAPSAGRYIDSYHPATGQVYCQVPDSDEQDMNKAVEAAKNAFPTWSKMTRQQRSDILMKVASLIEARLEEFAQAESQDQGKPVQLARSVDIPRAIYNFRYFAGKILYQTLPKTDLDGLALNYVQRVPLGVAGLISPWNLPLYLLTWKIAPAIAAGNTCVCKPSELTSVTAWMLCQVLKEAGVPEGVVNVVFGTGPRTGAPLVAHPDVPLISFTGGTVTGEAVIKASAPHYKKLSLELGGKNANIIFDDCDFEKCLATTVRSSFANQGEICLCGSRVFVHDSIYAKFLQALVERVKKEVVVGDPRDPKTTMGALVSQQHLDKVQYYVQLAKEEGGEIMWGGNRVSPLSSVDGTDLSKGYFMQPTIIATKSLTHSSKPALSPFTCRVMTEEIFGPVITVSPFATEQEVIAYANATKYGLSASVWTENGKRQRRVAEQIHAGTVWVNCWMVRDLNVPFGGMRQSGVGREGGEYSMEFYTEEKTICLANE